jgi:hypothetical protein
MHQQIMLNSVTTRRHSSSFLGKKKGQQAIALVVVVLLFCFCFFL